MRIAWVNQQYDIRYVRLQAPFDPASVGNQWQLDMKNNFWGIGVKAALEANWYLGWGFNVFGEAGFALLSGNFDTKFEQAAQSFIVGSSSNDFFDAKDNFHTNAPVADLGIGLEWNKLFCCDRFSFGAWIEYEHHIFFQQNQFMNFQYDFTLIQLLAGLLINEGPNFYTSNGNLTFDGLTVGVKFGF